MTTEPSRTLRPRGALILMLVLTVLWLAGVPFGLLVAAFSAFLADSGERYGAVTTVLYIALSFPVACVVAVIVGWSLYARRLYAGARRVMLAPALWPAAYVVGLLAVFR